MNSSSASDFKIALLPGDGIGAEVTEAAVAVLRECCEICDMRLEYETFSVGAGEYLKSGDPLPEHVFRRLEEFDAILLGAMGHPGVRWPNGIEMTPQIDLRERLDLYCGLRPIYLLNALDSPLRDQREGSIDLLLVRESTEGLFASRKVPPVPGATMAEDTMRITRKGSERIIRAAFEAARKRRKHVTLVDKANVLPSMAFFRSVFDDIAQEYRDVATNHLYVDAVALYLVRNPSQFDVLVTENMFGDILSDLLAGLVGGMGVAPSADLGDRFAVFQPSHGSAPDIAGQGIANPIATILSAGMMLERLGTEPCRRGARLIEESIRDLFRDPTMRTRDMKGNLTTVQMTKAVISAMRKQVVAA